MGGVKARLDDLRKFAERAEENSLFSCIGHRTEQRDAAASMILFRTMVHLSAS